MHATIAFCLMMVGGPVAPEAEITSIPLSNDQTAVTALQDLQWKERAKHLPLPRVTTINDSQPGTAPEDRINSWQKHRNGGSADPYSQRRAQANGTMPMAPTDPGELTSGRPSGPMPAVPGQGLNQNYSQNRSSSYNQANLGNGVNQPAFTQPAVTTGYGGAATSAPRAQGIQTVDSIVSNSTATARANLSGIAANPYLNPTAGGPAKPFSDYQRPNGYSPWMSLYTTPTNNGTVSTYSSSVQPQMQQQQYNAQFSESIRGVQTIQNRLQSGTPGYEAAPSTGAGLVNPNSYINYGAAGIR